MRGASGGGIDGGRCNLLAQGRRRQLPRAVARIAGRKDTLPLWLRLHILGILLRVVSAPLPPERRRDGLDESGDWGGEERAPQAEDLGEGKQEEERDERMDAYRMS